MFNWLFKKRGGAPAPQPAPVPAPVVQPNKAEVEARKAATADATKVLWLPQLQSAQGDDVALLRIALTAPLLEIKLAAVEALVTEDALRQAEREFRSHDRRAHQAAKRRLQAAVAQREDRTRATTLIETATALTQDVLLPANRLVTLDRDWQALNPDLLTPAQCTEFSELRDRLTASIRERGEQQQQLQRWTADATQALAELRLGCAQAAESASESGHDLATRSATARTLLEVRADVPATAALEQALQAALQSAACVEVRLAFLAALERAPAEVVVSTEATGGAEPVEPVEPTEAVEAETDMPTAESAERVEALSPAESVESVEVAEGVEAAPSSEAEPAPAAPLKTEPPPPTAVQRWRALAPLADSELSRLLNGRFEQWQRAQLPVRPAKPAARVTPRVTPRVAPVSPKAPSAEQGSRLDALLQQAESALAEGQLVDVQQHLQVFEKSLESMSGVVAGESLHARYQALQGEISRLEGWRQWGGGRALDDLVDEAEQLARRTLEAADPEVTDAPRLHLKTHGDAIHALRLRWKELQHQGAAADQTLWQRFDTALQAAHQPVAAQQAVLKADRQDNLLAREALLDTLEASPDRVEFANSEDEAAHWKEQMRSLDRFQLAWRQLGPVEHTVPHAARTALQQRLRSSIERIETPLREARRAAEIVREQLIARAEMLVQEVGANLQMRDAAPRVREIQAEWGQAARTLPLARAMETALWERFKAATDAVFAQRDAAFTARDAELAGNLAAREALLERLSALDSDAPAAEIQRMVAECDRAWSQGVDVPRGVAVSIDARFGDARAAALQMLADRGRQRWQNQCDTIAARLALCEERESASASTNQEDLEARWAALGSLPAGLEQALAQRWVQPVGAASGSNSESGGDEQLLQLEAALELPAAPEWQAARRDMKLRAMKNALEGRGPTAAMPARPADLLAAALRKGGTSPAQCQRLRDIVEALRRVSPEQIGLPAIRD